jgi:cytochrome c-type biogenesis protein CcmH/NrfG
MTNWKAVTVALGLALGWIVGNPAVALGPAPDPRAEVQVNVARVEGLTRHLRDNPQDVDEMEHLAVLYMANGSYDAALGPLARALQLDPHRRSLWVALDLAVEKSGRVRITDAELTTRASEFRKGVETKSSH